MGDDAEYEMERQEEERKAAEYSQNSRFADEELLGVLRSHLNDAFADGEHCAICGAAEGGLLNAAVIDEEELVVVCEDCLAKHGEELDEPVEEFDPPDKSEVDGGMHEDVR